MQKVNNIEKSLTSQMAPRLCTVCDRASFLKCMECDTIYCSSKCQIKDWEKHQHQHQKMASTQQQEEDSKQYVQKEASTQQQKEAPKQYVQPRLTPRYSVQNRLTIARS